MGNCLYILSGASGCGKTTLLNSLCPADGTPDPLTGAVRAPKYSDRDVRVGQQDRAGRVVPDDIIHVPVIQLGQFDIAYAINANKYGVRLGELTALLDRGLSPFIILSDFRVVRQLKEAMKGRARAIYVSSAIDPAKLRRIQLERMGGFNPDHDQRSVLSYHFRRLLAASRLGWWHRVSECVSGLEQDWQAYATDRQSTEVRIQKIRAFHIRYIERIALFDHVVLNYREGRAGDMAEQVRNLMNEAAQRPSYLPCSPIFVVAAASAAGKGTLMEMLSLIGGDRVRVTSKVALREQKKGDKLDGMIALKRPSGASFQDLPDWWTAEMREMAARGECPPEYDLRWSFHASATQYAVCSAEIERNLAHGSAQVFVSNMQQFQMLRERWPKNVVFIYLHRLANEEDIRLFQLERWSPEVAEARLAEREAVHADYIRQIADFGHVLLNTEAPEDLYDQMLNLLDAYGCRTSSDVESAEAGRACCLRP